MPLLRSPPGLLQALQAEADAARVSTGRQIRALQELFQRFTKERQALNKSPHYLDDPGLRLAYLRYHVPLNVARSTCALGAAVRAKPEIADWNRVVDLGAGPGTSALATLSSWRSARSAEILLTDRSRNALQVGRRLLAACASAREYPNPVVHTKVERLPNLPEIREKSIVWMSMVLNELVGTARKRFDPGVLVRRLEAAIPAPSVLIIVEPALRIPSRRLLDVREHLIASPKWRVLAPCTHAETCPLIEIRDRPWCHFHFDWHPGPWVDEVAKPLGLEARHGALSYLVVERVSPRESPRNATTSPQAARVIGDHMHVRGKKGGGIYICTSGERELLENPPEDIGRGDVIDFGESRESFEVRHRWSKKPVRRPTPPRRSADESDESAERPRSKSQRKKGAKRKTPRDESPEPRGKKSDKRGKKTAKRGKKKKATPKPSKHRK
ncbi:MAG: small ribosomal subunit Rsm22 family protein, partial [Planctomycetota bacterium]